MVRGFLCVLVPLGIMLLATALSIFLRGNLEFFEFWSSWVAVFPAVMVFVMIAVAYTIVLVYFLRILHWLRTRGIEFWNRETAPHSEGKTRVVDPVVARPLEESRYKFLEWVTISVVSWFSFIALVLLGEFAIEFTSIDLPATDGKYVKIMKKVAVKLPFFGDFLDLGILPGESLFGNISYFTVIIPLSIAIRNLMYLFEKRAEYSSQTEKSLLRDILLVILVTVLALFLISIIVTVLGVLDEYVSGI